MLVAFWQVQRLTREINSLEKQAMDVQTRLNHYQTYAGRLGASSNMTISNIAGLSSELIPRASLFAQYSDQASSMSAMQNLQMMKMMGRVPYTGNQMVDMQIQMSAFQQFKEQALKDLKQQETTVLNEKEKEIQLELNYIEQQLKTKRAQLESYKQLASKEAEESAPTFGLR
jgi:hypothetical protein